MIFHILSAYDVLVLGGVFAMFGGRGGWSLFIEYPGQMLEFILNNMQIILDDNFLVLTVEKVKVSDLCLPLTNVNWL